MTPSEVKRYLSERKTAPLNDIALHFDSNPDAIRGILDHWIRKGKVKKLDGQSCGGDCCGGDCGEHAHKEIYQWQQ